MLVRNLRALFTAPQAKRFGIVALATCLVLQQAPAPGLSAKAKGPATSGVPSRPESITPMLGVCDGSGVTDILSDLADPDANKKRNQIALLEGRILDCSRKITDALAGAPAPSPTPFWISAGAMPAAVATPSAACTHPPPATTASNRLQLFEILQRCSAFWTAMNATAAPAPSATTIASIASRPTFYVFAVGAVDATTATVLIRSLANRLALAQRRAAQARPARDAGDALAGTVVAGRADWTSTDSFAAQCQLDPNTRGALVLHTSMPENYRHNFFLVVSNFTIVSASVEVLGCGAEDHSLAVTPLSLYREDDIGGKSHQDGVTLGIFTAVAAFLATDRSKTTVTTGGGSTTITKSDSSAPAFSGSVVGYLQGENLTLPAQNSSVQMNVAGRRFADGTLQRLQNLCSQPEIRRLAAEADPLGSPASLVVRRSLLSKAAVEYLDDCARFANFEAGP